jgi:serine/threonine-protein kinase
VADIGATLGGRYRLERVLGYGGMSTIFAATDGKLGRVVAVKVLRPEFGADAAFVERFRREAQSAASLNHPNVVAVYDYGTDAAGPYIVMEQVTGGDLSRVLDERGALPPTAVARTGQQVADALAAAHARGIVHRDIKPGNILLAPDGRVQVADFGIAQAAAESPVTSSGITVGSVLYFSPEQARGEPATPASDVYSLGLVLYEMLTGQRAFSGDSPAAVAVARLSGGVPSPSALRPEVPAPLDAIVRWCLSADPEGRPTAAELSTTLTRFLADPTGAAAYASTSTYPVAPAYGTTSMAAMPADPSATSMTVLTAQPPMPPMPSERSGSGPWGWVAAVLGLLVIVASGILLFLLFSGMGEPSPSSPPPPSPSPTAELVVTPDVVTFRLPRAERVAADAGFELEVRYQEADPVDVGRVIDQLPQAGTEVALGTTLAVTIGTGAETVVVPNVRGMRADDAEAELVSDGLVLGERIREESSQRRGYVIRTEPRAGVTMTRGSAVDLYISSGRAPDATPTPTPRATRTPRPSRTPRPTPSPTRPPSGPTPTPTAAPTATPTAAPTATPTPTPTPAPTPSPSPSPPPTPEPTPTVSPSPLPSPVLVVVGDYSCQALGDVRPQIESVGLMVGTLIPDDPPPEDSWLVQGQLPPAGESVPIGSAVDLHLEDPVEPCPSA